MVTLLEIEVSSAFAMADTTLDASISMTSSSSPPSATASVATARCPTPEDAAPKTE
jgi:hypothetical protein